MELKKDPHHKMFTCLLAVLLTISLLAQRCEGRRCYECEAGRFDVDQFDNCEEGPPTVRPSSPYPDIKPIKDCTDTEFCSKFTLFIDGKKNFDRRTCWDFAE